MESTSYLLVQTGFILITIIFVGLFLKEILTGLRLSELHSKIKIRNWIITGLLVWLVIVSTLSLSGVLQNFSSTPPKMIIVLIVPLITILIITFSGSLNKILVQIPIRNIIRLQVFRVFVEILLWRLFVLNLLPVQMSFEGRNFDILAGLTAPLVAYFLTRYRVVMIIWNFIGLGLLINIVTIALLSMPTPFRIFMNEPPNTIVAYFPIVLLPAFLVPLAYTLHFFSVKQLLSKA